MMFPKNELKCDVFCMTGKDDVSLPSRVFVQKMKGDLPLIYILKDVMLAQLSFSLENTIFLFISESIPKETLTYLNITSLRCKKVQLYFFILIFSTNPCILYIATFRAKTSVHLQAVS